MKEDIFNAIHCMIEDYVKYTYERPYIMLISPKTYSYLIECLKDTSAFRYLAKIEKDNDKLNYIFGVPFEISDIIIHKAILLNKKDYKEYCIQKYLDIKE